MSILGDVRRRLHRYRFADLPPETREAVLQVREFEESRTDPGTDRPMMSRNIRGCRYELYESPRYIKDREYLEGNGYDLSDLDRLISILLDGGRLPRRHRVHRLKGDMDGLWDCHVKDDWILLYRYSADGLVLEAVRTGSHKRLLGI